LKTSSSREATIVAAATVALTLPFIGKPFQIDDDIYLQGAEQILRSPLHPLSGTMRIFGELMPTYRFTQHPPGLSYFMAAVKLLSGRADEPTLHLSFLAFSVSAMLALYALSRRFTSSPLPATLLVLATPAFLVMAHDLMTDVPFLALFLGATAAAVYGIDEGRLRLLLLFSVLLPLACFVQYRGVILIPPLLAYAVLRRRRIGATMLACVPAAVLFLLWGAYTRYELGVAHPLDAGSLIKYGWGRLAKDACAHLTFLGGATVCPVFLLYAIRDRLRVVAAGLTLALGIAAAEAGFTMHYTTGQRGLFFFFLATGFATLFAMLPSLELTRRVWRGLRTGDTVAYADNAFLLLMVAVPLASQVVVNIFASVRGLLLSLPFLVLLLTRHLERRAGGRTGVLAAALWVGVALTLTGGLTLAVADLRFAEAARDVARRATTYRPAQHAAWFTGEWGFRHYLEREGFTSFTASDSLADGDVLVAAEVACPSDLGPVADRLHLVGTIESLPAFPITVMSFETHAGFYSNGWGLLPYSFAKGPLERVRVFRVGQAEPRLR
jgi:Dolichyl-phosphate-mannose-protein mannosyltransferase